METQVQSVLAYMQRNGSITQEQARLDCGCTRLAARINDLKRDGHYIHRSIVRVRTRNGEARIARYSLAPVVDLSSTSTVTSAPDSGRLLFDVPPSRESMEKTGKAER